jgi:hypothetical protein
LYTSADIRQEVVRLFSVSNGRRVAISAFVGEGAEAYLPKPAGLELICWPKEGGTNPDVLRRLMKRGAKVSFVDSLHMKLYWSEDLGAVLTSANLSTNALGSGNLKEIGILLPSEQIDIERVIESLKKRPLTGLELRRLDRRHKDYAKRNRRAGQRARISSFEEWYKSPFRPKWKLGWYDSTGTIAKEAKRISKQKYNVSEPKDYLDARRGDYMENDWVLRFNIKKPSAVDWLFVDFMVKVPETEKGYDRKYPFQAIQVWTAKKYPPYPFRIDQVFKHAFADASTAFGLDRIKCSKTCESPKRLLQLISQRFSRR